MIKNIDKELRRVASEFKTLSHENLVIETKNLERDLARQTPVLTGLAQRSWSMTDLGEDRGLLIKNAVDYIDELNEGSSSQAPSHFIEATALKYGSPVGAITKNT